MTNDPFKDAVAIDTNVFEHIMNPQQNVASHISELLSYLQERKIGLIVDQSGRVAGEYLNQLAALIGRSDDIGIEISIPTLLDKARLSHPCDGNTKRRHDDRDQKSHHRTFRKRRSYLCLHRVQTR